MRPPPCSHFCKRDLEAQTALALTRLNLSVPASLPASCLRSAAASPQPPPSLATVALVVRGESFRHFTRPSPSTRFDVPAVLRRRLICSPLTYALQRALAANHVAHLIEPLERRGTRVEVFLATYGCWTVLPAADAARWHEDLRGWYDGGAVRVRHHAPVARTGAGGSQAALLSAALAPVLRRGTAAFGAVLLWRFDLAAPAALAGGAPTPGDFLSRAHATVAQVRPRQETCRLTACTSAPRPSLSPAVQVGYDLAWSLPASLLRCFSEIVGRAAPSCWGHEASGVQAIGCSALLAHAAAGLGGGDAGAGAVLRTRSGAVLARQGVGCDAAAAAAAAEPPAATGAALARTPDGCPSAALLRSPGPKCRALLGRRNASSDVCEPAAARREVCTHLVRACLAPRGARRSTALARSTAFGAHELGCCKKSAARVPGFRRQGYG